MSVRFMESHHTTPSRCYRFTDARGKSLVYIGDTAPLTNLPAFASGCDVLIHESAFADRSSREWNLYCHSSAVDAAEAAGAGALYLVHMVKATATWLNLRHGRFLKMSSAPKNAIGSSSSIKSYSFGY